ncbi:MAG TPA: hypothetical protein VH054_25375, partial [Polyangiaceae bacterium]|nr:hypothetical protein [Polyangiaceae bacterium]
MAPPLPTLTVNPLSVGLDAFHAVAAASYAGIDGVRSTFELVLAEGDELCVLAGVEPLVDALERFRIKTEEATYLHEAGAISSELARK